MIDFYFISWSVDISANARHFGVATATARVSSFFLLQILRYLEHFSSL